MNKHRNWFAGSKPRLSLGKRAAGSRNRMGYVCFELLESRALLSADGISMRNLLNRPDVNSDGHVSPLDALMVINDLNANGSHSVSSSTSSLSGPVVKAASVTASSTFVTDTSSSLLDVNGDGAVTPNDVNAII